MSLAVHGDDFTFCGTDKELKWITKQMQEWYEVKVRAALDQTKKMTKKLLSLGEQLNGVHGESRGRQTRSTKNC